MLKHKVISKQSWGTRSYPVNKQNYPNRAPSLPARGPPRERAEHFGITHERDRINEGGKTIRKFSSPLPPLTFCASSPLSTTNTPTHLASSVFGRCEDLALASPPASRPMSWRKMSLAMEMQGVGCRTPRLDTYHVPSTTRSAVDASIIISSSKTTARAATTTTTLSCSRVPNFSA